MKRMRLATVLLLLGISSSLAVGQGSPSADLSGNWNLSMTATLPNQGTCGFEGSAQVTQMNGKVSGSAVQMRVSGSPQDCPSTMMADLAGTLRGNQFSGTLDGGAQFGTATVQGTVGPDGMSLTGTFSTPSANGASAAAAPAASPAGPPPFPGIMGNWQAQVQAAMEIPLLSGLGLALLVSLVLLASLLILRRANA